MSPKDCIIKGIKNRWRIENEWKQIVSKCGQEVFKEILFDFKE